jgi:branched-chain amino acid transport system substrate-binding protein
MKKSRSMVTALAVMVTALVFASFSVNFAEADVVKIGLNYPKTGPYMVQGLDQMRATRLAVEEINAAGGILGKNIEVIARNSMSKPNISSRNATELIDNEGVKMILGGVSSGVAIAAARVCQEKGTVFFGTLTYSTATTGKEGLKHTFRECYNAWPAAKVIGSYLKKNFSGKKYYYITADYTWGHTTEDSMRKFTGTTDTSVHKRILNPFPGATLADFKKAIASAKEAKPDVLVLVLFGKDMEMAVRLATAGGLKKKMQIVVPNLTLGMAEGGGAKVMQGVVGALPWCWEVPYKYNYARGKEFVEKFATTYGRYPGTSGASAYTILYEYKAAVEKAGTFDSDAVIKSLEGHEYQLLKNKQVWRDFDHQSVQTVYAVKCKPQAEVVKDKYKLDYFEIIGSLGGKEAFRTRAEWNAVRKAAGKPAKL